MKRTHEEYWKLLRQEAEKIQTGLVREGQIAADTLDLIGRVQAQQR
jgi:hypothetical protein